MLSKTEELQEMKEVIVVEITSEIAIAVPIKPGGSVQEIFWKMLENGDPLDVAAMTEDPLDAVIEPRKALCDISENSKHY